jgi:hypothetical protein
MATAMAVTAVTAVTRLRWRMKARRFPSSGVTAVGQRNVCERSHPCGWLRSFFGEE